MGLSMSTSSIVSGWCGPWKTAAFIRASSVGLVGSGRRADKEIAPPRPMCQGPSRPPAQTAPDSAGDCAAWSSRWAMELRSRTRHGAREITREYGRDALALETAGQKLCLGNAAGRERVVGQLDRARGIAQRLAVTDQEDRHPRGAGDLATSQGYHDPPRRPGLTGGDRRHEPIGIAGELRASTSDGAAGAGVEQAPCCR